MTDIRHGELESRQTNWGPAAAHGLAHDGCHYGYDSREGYTQGHTSSKPIHAP